jgi:ATP-dependent Zn protease
VGSSQRHVAAIEMTTHHAGARTAELFLGSDEEGRPPRFLCADLKNLVNEAALLAARREQNEVRQKHFLDAVEKIMLGPERLRG